MQLVVVVEIVVILVGLVVEVEVVEEVVAPYSSRKIALYMV